MPHYQGRKCVELAYLLSSQPIASSLAPDAPIYDPHQDLMGAHSLVAQWRNG